MSGIDSPALERFLAQIQGVLRGGRGAAPRSARTPRPLAAAALELSQDSKITKFTVVWDGSLLGDRAITALAADAVDR
jgi:hypothetical protein